MNINCDFEYYTLIIIFTKCFECNFIRFSMKFSVEVQFYSFFDEVFCWINMYVNMLAVW